MISAEEEALVHRYLSGSMNEVEEHEFFIKLALDNELRQRLDEQKRMRSAPVKDRTSGIEKRPAPRKPVRRASAEPGRGVRWRNFFFKLLGATAIITLLVLGVIRLIPMFVPFSSESTVARRPIVARERDSVPPYAVRPRSSAVNTWSPDPSLRNTGGGTVQTFPPDSSVKERKDSVAVTDTAPKQPPVDTVGGKGKATLPK